MFPSRVAGFSPASLAESMDGIRSRMGKIDATAGAAFAMSGEAAAA